MSLQVLPTPSLLLPEAICLVISPTFALFQCLERAVWKGLLKILTAIVHGLEVSASATVGNLCTASAFRALEMAHTHYWTRLELAGDNDPSDPSKVERGSEVAEVTSSTLSTPVASSTVRATAIRA